MLRTPPVTTGIIASSRGHPHQRVQGTKASPASATSRSSIEPGYTPAPVLRLRSSISHLKGSAEVHTPNSFHPEWAVEGRHRSYDRETLRYEGRLLVGVAETFDI
jgi:hypothetical protein